MIMDYFFESEENPQHAPLFSRADDTDSSLSSSPFDLFLL